MQRPWVTVDEAAELTGRTPKAIYQWVREGLVECHRPGDVMWLELADVMKVSARKRRGRPRKDTHVS